MMKPENVEFADALNKLFMEHSKKNNWTVSKTIQVFLGSAVAAVMAQELGHEVGIEKLKEYNVNAPENQEAVKGAMENALIHFFAELLKMGAAAGMLDSVKMQPSDALRNMKES